MIMKHLFSFLFFSFHYFSGIEVEEGESTFSITQEDILKESDEQTNQKAFELTLDKLGPYSINYTRNGRILVLGGRKGHIATLDWQRKKLKTEFNVAEQINDITYEMLELFF